MEWQRLAYTSIGTFGASACANTLNQIYEVANDGRMTRTRMRPLPLGRVTRLQALAFAAVMGLGGAAILNSQVGCRSGLLRKREGLFSDCLTGH